MGARIIEDALDRIGAGVEPQLFQFPRNPLVASEEIFRPNADDDIAQFLRQARSSHGLKGASTTHLGEPPLVGRGLGHFHQPIDIMPAFFPNAQQLGFLGRR